MCGLTSIFGDDEAIPDDLLYRLIIYDIFLGSLLSWQIRLLMPPMHFVASSNEASADDSAPLVSSFSQCLHSLLVP